MDPKPDEIETLLHEAEAAHGRYEATELQGVYDEAWASWYAAYVVDHGLAARLGHGVTAAGVGAFLASTFLEFKAAQPSESWAAYTARRMAAEL